MHVNREQATQLKKNNTPKQPRVALTTFCSNHERDKTHSTTTQSRTCFELDHAQLQLQLHVGFIVCERALRRHLKFSKNNQTKRFLL